MSTSFCCFFLNSSLSDAPRINAILLINNIFEAIGKMLGNRIQMNKNQFILFSFSRWIFPFWFILGMVAFRLEETTFYANSFTTLLIVSLLAVTYGLGNINAVILAAKHSDPKERMPILATMHIFSVFGASLGSTFNTTFNSALGKQSIN